MGMKGGGGSMLGKMMASCGQGWGRAFGRAVKSHGLIPVQYFKYCIWVMNFLPN